MSVRDFKKSLADFESQMYATNKLCQTFDDDEIQEMGKELMRFRDRFYRAKKKYDAVEPKTDEVIAKLMIILHNGYRAQATAMAYMGHDMIEDEDA